MPVPRNKIIYFPFFFFQQLFLFINGISTSVLIIAVTNTPTLRARRNQSWSLSHRKKSQNKTLGPLAPAKLHKSCWIPCAQTSQAREQPKLRLQLPQLWWKPGKGAGAHTLPRDLQQLHRHGLLYLPSSELKVHWKKPLSNHYHNLPTWILPKNSLQKDFVTTM